MSSPPPSGAGSLRPPMRTQRFRQLLWAQRTTSAVQRTCQMVRTSADQAYCAYPEVKPSWRRSHPHQPRRYCSTAMVQTATASPELHACHCDAPPFCQLGIIHRPAMGCHHEKLGIPWQLPPRLVENTTSTATRQPSQPPPGTTSSSASHSHLPRLQDQLPSIRSMARQQTKAGHQPQI